MNIKFSLIIPTFNSAKDLERLLGSFIHIKGELDQVEIIVVDDGSVDETEKVVRSFEGRFEAIEYVFQKNRGPAAARNMGARKAKGEYLIFVDEDCFMPKGCIDKIKDFYKDNMNYAGLGIKSINSSGGVLAEYNQRLGYYLIDESYRDSDHSYGFVSSRCYSFSKDSFWTINGHDEGFIWAAEDRDFCLRIREGNMRLFYLQTLAVINSDHLCLRNFIRQNFGYGFGAGMFVQKHPGCLSFKFSRYRKMFETITKDNDPLKQFKLILTFFLAQLCSLVGIIFYKCNFDYERRPPSIFPPRHFVWVETFRNFIYGIPYFKTIKRHLGSFRSPADLYSDRQSVVVAQKTFNIYQEVISKEYGEENWLNGKKILVIGLGADLSVPILLMAQGAAQVVALNKSRSGNLNIQGKIGFEKKKGLNYLPNTFIDSREIREKLPADYFDLVVSFNTIECIIDLNTALNNMKFFLKEDGIMIHRVDAGSHHAISRHCRNRLSHFLFSDTLWSMMFSQRDAPMRRVLADYIKIAQDEGISMREFYVDELASEGEVNNIHRFLFDRFRQHSSEIRKIGFILLGNGGTYEANNES